MADDELDELYWVSPDKFTATRSRLAATAKERGDADSAKQISAARKPTTAAWVVNRLALSHAKAAQRLTELGERLRAAHSAMDGERIRQLSADQRKLIEELARTGFDAAETKEPSAGLREDVTGTLQAAIADPEVAARLGRLAKPEQYSGFGDFGFTAAESMPAKPRPDRGEIKRAQAALAEAEQAKNAADEALAAARRRYEEAEQELQAAEEASRDATKRVKEAAAQLKRAGR
ncbi:MAG: hypothetical protein ACXV5U_12095 [Ilumatobacteraceae bacterium]